MPITKCCETCGSEFQVRPYLAPAKKHCSNACRAAANRVALTCECCGKSFWTWKSQITEKHPGRFCSKVCADKSKIKAIDKPEKVKRDPVFKVCATCGASFRVPPTRRETAIYCSVKCKSANADYRAKSSEVQQGDKAWRWSGGKYKKRDGYIRVKWNQQGQQVCRVEHRLVMLHWMIAVDPDHPFLVTIDGHLRLHPDIEVHHIDRDRANNARENLLAVTKTAHAQIHHRGRKPEPWECWPSNPAAW